MTNRLEPIISQKRREVAELNKLILAQPEHRIAKIMAGKERRDSSKSFSKALRNDQLSIIAEIKRKSPSKGQLAEIVDPLVLANNYIEGGANALSILTDELFFGGSLADLTKVAQQLINHPTPILRKDFTIDIIQIAQAIAAGADAILCIVAVTGKNTQAILTAADQMGIEVLVEVHNEAELDIALVSGAKIIGVNNRNLKTFEIDTNTAFGLRNNIPGSIISIAESGILVPELALKYYHAGFDAVLIGEALVTTDKPKQFIEACRHG